MLLTYQDAARRYGVDTKTIRRWAIRFRWRVFHPTKETVRFRLDELEAWEARMMLAGFNVFTRKRNAVIRREIRASRQNFFSFYPNL